MQNKTVWEGHPAIYVNFAMKKVERIEHLQKKREELFKIAQKMTVFSKIKDENAISSEQQFTDAIKNYLAKIIGKDYTPKSIKVKYETKNAFITMNSQKDAEEFIKKFQEYSKDNSTSLFFNLYKSKVERISANTFLKKYNSFNDTEVNIFNKNPKNTRYIKYNNMIGQVNAMNMNMMGQMQEFPYSTLNHQNVRYNQFDEMPNPSMNIVNQRGYVSYNNFNSMPIMQVPQPMMHPMENQLVHPSKIDPHDEDSVGEFLFNFIEKIYPE
jgi:hypothetical protein